MIPSFVFCVALVFLAEQGPFIPTGKYDLGPEDIKELCTVVDGQAPPIAEGCVYMKWVPCEGEEKPERPCGWYEQTKCPGVTKREVKNYRNSDRSIWVNNYGHAKDFKNASIVPFLGFPY